jgi:hypothetical protein
MGLPGKKKDELVDYLCKHICEPTDPESMELVFLQAGNILNRTGIYVNSITGYDIESHM